MTSARPVRGAILLAGGRSTRMGRDKATLPFGKSTLLGHVAGALAPLVDEIVIVSRRGQALPPLAFAGVRVRMAHDEVEDRGPLGGMAAGLACLDAPVAFLSSCDAPLLTGAFVAALFDALGAADIAVPDVGGRIHPLAGVYRRDPVLAAVRTLLAADRLRPVFLLEGLAHVRVPEDRLRAADPHLHSLENVNSPEDLARAIARLEPPSP